jgi:DNA-binding MarR family transcriptional regulator
LVEGGGVTNPESGPGEVDSQYSPLWSELDHKILAFLKLADGLVLGGDIASALGVAGSGIGPRLVSLRRGGYVYSAIPPNARRGLGWGLTEKGSGL